MSKENVAKWIRNQVPTKQQVRASWNKGSFMFGRPDWFRDKEVGWSERCSLSISTGLRL